MTRLFAAHVVAVLAHVLDDVAIAYGSAGETQSEPPQVTLQSQIGHHRCNHTACSELAAPMPTLRDHCHDLIAVDDAALLVDDHHAVGIAIERDANVGAHLTHLFAKCFRPRRAALVIDIAPIGINADLDDLCAELPQCVGGHLVARPIGAIDDNAQFVEADIARQRALGELDVALLRALHPRRPTDAICSHQQLA